jgi:hypothetical protein
MIGQYAGSSAGSYGNAGWCNMIGYNAGGSAGSGAGNADYCNMIGHNAGVSAGDAGNAGYSNMIGYDAGGSAGTYGNAGYCNMIGSGAGSYAGAFGGNASECIMIGVSAGYFAGYSSNVNRSIYIGFNSGANQKAQRNTFIGGETNTLSPSSASLSGCIALGYGAKPSARNTIAFGSSTVPLSVIPGGTIISSVSGLKIMVNGVYYTLPLLA